MKKTYLLLISALVLAWTVLMAGCSIIPGSKEDPVEAYKQISANIQNLNSAQYHANQVTQMDFTEKSQAKTITDINTSEVYKKDSMDMAMDVSYKGHTNVTDYSVFFKDNIFYADMNDHKTKEKMTLDKLTTGETAVTNPLVYLKGNNLFAIAEEDITDPEIKSDGDNAVLSFSVNAESLEKYFAIELDVEKSLYTTNIDYMNYNVSFYYDESYLPYKIEITSDMAISQDTPDIVPATGSISMTYTFDKYNAIKKIDFPDFSGYKGKAK